MRPPLDKPPCCGNEEFVSYYDIARKSDTITGLYIKNKNDASSATQPESNVNGFGKRTAGRSPDRIIFDECNIMRGVDRSPASHTRQPVSHELPGYLPKA